MAGAFTFSPFPHHHTQGIIPKKRCPKKRNRHLHLPCNSRYGLPQRCGIKVADDNSSRFSRLQLTVAETGKQHLDAPLWSVYDPLLPGGAPIQRCKWTLRDSVNTVIGHMREHVPRRGELESVLQLYASMLPERHVLPTSLYMINRLAGVRSWYSLKDVAGRAVWEPVHWFIYSGIEEVVHTEFFTNPQFCQEHGQFHGDATPGSSQWQGEWVESLKSYAGGIALHPDSSIYDISIDWIAPYNSTQHSIGILFIRCADMDPHNKGKIWNQRVIAIIPGPRMPSVLHPYLQPIVDDLLRLASDGMRVSPAAAPANPEAAEGAAAGGAGGTAVGGMADGQAPADGDLRGTWPFQHRVFLGQVLADTPARAKVACGNGQNSRVGSCMWCLFEAHMEANVGCGATVRFRGYTQAVSQHFVKRNAGKSLKVGARALKKTHRHFVSTGGVMQAMYRMLHLAPHKITQKQFDEPALQTGCKGLTAFVALPYIDLSCLFTVSTGHALLFRVVSNFVDYTLTSLNDIKPADPDAELVMSREARQRVAARGQFLVVTSDFGRRYKCIMQYRKSYRMEDWLHFVETFSSYIFKGDVLPEALRALWWSLCSAVTHYFWPRPPDKTREQFLVAAKAAACKLRAYTTRLEELEVPGYMFTINLHICVCRLYDQECQLGSAAGFSDLPVERMMQQMKMKDGRMVSQAPEKHYTQWLCLMWASESLTEADHATGAKCTTNQQLERMLAWRAARSFLHAEALDEEQYFRAEYGRQQQRTSCWACYQAEVGNEARTYAAYLKYFVHLPTEDGAQDVHFAVADVYSGQVFSGGLVVVNMAAAQTARAGSQWEMWQPSLRLHFHLFLLHPCHQLLYRQHIPLRACSHRADTVYPSATILETCAGMSRLPCNPFGTTQTTQRV
ncbi:hypothetical protein VOLCADRAFT_95128 [Volvox carteri f. nagariensis]|uniref:Uncharacterized protein n=1 Tax=Volvox carteri f. nagariensis TaxID=3068 RepID=D8U6P0_VOLCA|nr:uncharacterized protein VOLCADRAFT_95128 [Volvox carteri f. nagariensis]EFJ44542.1 hypothetical protein VOLCADRAFT_95128 [Volvox carteri f. nagariensis]|eukprot:XP_002954392.1 hypothetical protein VOLCADRAFT_95128 [Volvox carteri f. nagariensis]